MNSQAEELLAKSWAASNPLRRWRDPLLPILLPSAFTPPSTLRDRIESSVFIRSVPQSTQSFAFASQLRKWAVERANLGGLFLEFGVASGGSTRQLGQAMRANSIASKLYAFDSFQGLPENWLPGRGRGYFAQSRLPPVDENTVLEVGKFQDTLEPFLRSHPGTVSLAHVDCDLYSSAKYVLETLLDHARLIPGSVLVFDELFNYPGWSGSGEFRALTELFPKGELNFEVAGIVPANTQVAVRLKRRRPSGEQSAPHRILDA
jgi:hypothetical protein